jgi:hypothetical protein
LPIVRNGGRKRKSREAGLEPLAEALLARSDQSPEHVAHRYVEPNKGVIDSAAALEGARAILVERFSEDATLIGTLREEGWSRRPPVFASSCGSGGARRQVRRLLRVQRSFGEIAVAPHPGAVPRREGGGADTGADARPGRAGSRRTERLRAADREPVQDRRSWSARRPPHAQKSP